MRICSAKLLSALSTTVALVTLLPGITFAAPAQPSSTGTTTAQTQTDTTPGGTTPAGGSMNSTSQPTRTTGQKPSGSRKKMSSEINAVLNPTQRTQLAQARKAGKKLPEALQGLGLTADQQSKIDAIMAKYKTGSGSSTMSQPGAMQQPSTTSPATQPK